MNRDVSEKLTFNPFRAERTVRLKAKLRVAAIAGPPPAKLRFLEPLVAFVNCLFDRFVFGYREPRLLVAARLELDGEIQGQPQSMWIDLARDVEFEVLVNTTSGEVEGRELILVPSQWRGDHDAC